MMLPPLARTLIRATQDVGPSALLALSFKPSFISTAERLKDTIPRFTNRRSRSI